MEKIFNYIGGERREPIHGKWLENIDPSKGLAYSMVPDSDEADISQAVESAKQAFPLWSSTSYEDRARLLEDIAAWIEREIDLLASAEAKDQGKPFWLAKEVDIPRAAQNFRFFAGQIRYQLESASSMPGGSFNYTLRKPVGVAGLISPWNLPLYLLSWKIAPALATGNTAVCKPSELTPMTAYLLTQIFDEVGLPSGVCNIVFGRGDRAGAPLTAHPDVPLISFTGGTATAEKIIHSTAPYFKKLSLELGGKNPNIIFADCDLKKAVKGSVRSSFLNQGEICLCGSRILIEESIYEPFKEAFLAEVKELRVGDPFDNDNFMGPLVSEAHLEKVKGYIEKARSLGGTILTGGDGPQYLDDSLKGGYYIRPTVIEGLSQDCEVIQEEIFGPVVTLQKFSSEEEAINLANDVRYGLSASVWTESLSRSQRLGQKLQVGSLWVNCWLKRDLRVPFGGMKASGVGREGGLHSLDFFTEATNVCIG